MKTRPAPFVDTHCHLNLAAFQNDLEAVLERAHDAGITKILVPGTDFETSQRAVTLAGQHPGVYAAVGFHPHDAQKWDRSNASQLKQLAEHPGVVAIGEIGLDYYRNLSGREVQRRAFEEQLELAIELELPVIVHNRDATTDVLAMINEWVKELPQNLQGRAGVLHAFSADEIAASNAIEMGFYIGIAGPVTFQKAEALRSLVSNLPIKRILTETDAPYLTPDPHRGKRNEPGHVQFVAAAIAETRQVELEQAKGQMAANARILFQWNHELSNSNIL
ncbi:MAG: TatD family hydrolase [Anaerolineales bacterium]|nr:TatD family hydrolase [Anaerolineales bacterium]